MTTDLTMPSPAPERRKVPRWLIYFGTASAAALLYAFVDRPAATWMLARTDQEPWMAIRTALRPFGAGVPQGIILIIVTVAGIWLDKPKLARAGKWLVLAFAITVLLTAAVKHAVRRPRPGHMDAPRPSMSVQVASSEWHSFPSGDVAATTTIMVLLWGLMGRPRKWRWLLLIPFLVATQRFVAARHFPADIICGAMLGAWVAQQTLRRIPPYRDWRSVPRRKERPPANDPA